MATRRLCAAKSDRITVFLCDLLRANCVVFSRNFLLGPSEIQIVQQALFPGRCCHQVCDKRSSVPEGDHPRSLIAVFTASMMFST